MTSTTFFFIFIPILASILLGLNIVFAPHNPYQEKNSAFECGFHSFLGQNRTQFSISFFIFALLFLLFDLEILLIYPYAVSAYTNGIYGLVIMLIFFLALTLGFAFEINKNALKIDSRQIFKISKNIIRISNLISKVILSNPPKPHPFVDHSIHSIILNPTGSILDYVKLYLEIFLNINFRLFNVKKLIVDRSKIKSTFTLPCLYDLFSLLYSAFTLSIVPIFYFNLYILSLAQEININDLNLYMFLISGILSCSTFYLLIVIGLNIYYKNSGNNLWLILKKIMELCLENKNALKFNVKFILFISLFFIFISINILALNIFIGYLGISTNNLGIYIYIRLIFLPFIVYINNIIFTKITYYLYDNKSKINYNVFSENMFKSITLSRLLLLTGFISLFAFLSPIISDYVLNMNNLGPNGGNPGPNGNYGPHINTGNNDNSRPTPTQVAIFYDNLRTKVVNRIRDTQVTTSTYFFSPRKSRTVFLDATQALDNGEKKAVIAALNYANRNNLPPGFTRYAIEYTGVRTVQANYPLHSLVKNCPLDSLLVLVLNKTKHIYVYKPCTNNPNDLNIVLEAVNQARSKAHTLASAWENQSQSQNQNN